MTVDAAREALRIVRTVEVEFATGHPKTGCAFIVGPRRLITCAHVVLNDQGERASRVLVTHPDRSRRPATVAGLDNTYDLACLEAAHSERPPSVEESLPTVGQQIVFAGMPQGVKRVSVFPGMVSAVGEGLLPHFRCRLIQIAGMVNNGNSGGPLLDVSTGAVVGVVTAKYVPLLTEIDKLARMLETIPQFPSSVGLGGIDFSKFVNMTIGSMWQLAAVLRLVQVGTGWAVPACYFDRVEEE